jgi:hypothetical protein
LILFLKYTEAINLTSTWDTKSLDAITSIRQEQKPGLLSDRDRAASAGRRTVSSPLIELANSVYIAGKSEADNAIRSDDIVDLINQGNVEDEP